MKVRLAVVGGLVAVATLSSGCSSGSSSKPAAASAKGSSTTAKAGVSPSTSGLPANIPRSEQFCALTSALADKFKGAKKPDNPAELAPYIRDLVAFLQQASSVAPAALQPDVQRLTQFYAPLADQIESGKASTANILSKLGDAAAASTRLREYFSKICGVDDKVFTL